LGDEGSSEENGEGGMFRDVGELGLECLVSFSLKGNGRELMG
jgi:hypothetical protein